MSIEALREQAERQRVVSPYQGVGFGFDDHRPTWTQVDRLLSELQAEYKDAVFDKRSMIRIETSASRPGSEAYNRHLTERRAAALTQMLRERGVEGRIDVFAAGESLARAAPSPMTLIPQSDSTPLDARDDARFRVAFVTVEPHATDADFESLLVTGDRSPDVQFLKDFDAGKQLFASQFAPIAERVRTIVPAPENPLGADPSADPGEFLSQVADKVREALKAAENPKEMAKLGAKYIAGSLFEIVRTKWREETARHREPLYAAAAEGLAAGLHPQYTKMPQADSVRQKLFDRMYDTATRLSDTEKDQLGIYLVERYRREQIATAMDTPSEAHADVVKHLDGGVFERAAASIFKADHYARD